MIRRSEAFDADEATELFWSYYTTGAIPDSYALRPMEGYTADGAIIDLQDGSRLSRPTD